VNIGVFVDHGVLKQGKPIVWRPPRPACVSAAGCPKSEILPFIELVARASGLRPRCEGRKQVPARLAVKVNARSAEPKTLMVGLGQRQPRKRKGPMLAHIRWARGYGLASDRPPRRGWTIGRHQRNREVAGATRR